MLILTQRKRRWHDDGFDDADVAAGEQNEKEQQKGGREINEFLPRFEVGIAVARVRSFHNYYTAELSGKRCCSELISLSLYFTERLVRFKNR